ncbi:MAG TPA: elongation factor G [Anaerohalosphaeraceae bacterium]|nr:elongation factor G [Phycisphaerae bacterium]HOL31415.1 elongation factor G [Anaerohalosphaeraceae bacterium]HPC63231.1 elongation factor G [Anaerohalosphaeraceae bacterium]HPO69284.1 elongation factor G [Anaerohalosphaeraceae bacterium]HRS70321.1 elongation factor G [Anaerohalosphaeraceae bacterium]
MANLKDIRNIVLLGHGNAGKTSLVEAILHTAGVTTRLGSVEEKNTVSDYDDEEKQRGNSIHSSLMYINFNGTHINLIDTPGYPDFVSPALVSIPAAETALIVISASAGIEMNTRKLFAAATSAGKARVIVVNKMDSENADLTELVSQIQESFGQQCRCANLPSADKTSVIDCIANEAGQSAVMDVAQAHTELLESVIEADDALMESYLGGEAVSPEKIADVFVKAVMAGTVIPIVFTNARKEIGIKELLTLIANCTPSPADVPPAVLKHGDKTIEVKADPNGPLAGLVFRIGYDPRSNMKYASIRLFSGSLDSGTQLYINDAKKPVRPGHPLKMQGGEVKEVEKGLCGDIITLAKIDELKLGDTVHNGSFEGKFAMPPVPKPMFALALEPVARGDENKISAALEKLADEDACFKVTRDTQTKELVINGLGDLHLRVMLSKLENRYKVHVNTKPPKIPYRETITGKAEGHYRHKKQTGGAGQFGEVYLRVEPAPRDSDPSLIYSWDIFGGSIPGQFEPAILKGINDVMENGFLAGFPMQDIKVSIYDGKYHPVDSKEVAFRTAGKGAFLDALEKAKPTLLEPIVNIEITVPAENMGDITGDLASRRGRVSGQEMLPGGMMVIKAQVPLAEVANYNSQLKSVTGGQGSYSMELSHYEPTPPNIQQQVIEQYKKEKQEEKE